MARVPLRGEETRLRQQTTALVCCVFFLRPKLDFYLFKKKIKYISRSGVTKVYYYKACSGETAVDRTPLSVVFLRAGVFSRGALEIDLWIFLVEYSASNVSISVRVKLFSTHEASERSHVPKR